MKDSTSGRTISQIWAFTRSRRLLLLAVVFHLSLLAPWWAGFWNRFTFDSTATHGRRGWDFYALYQAGRNVLTGVSAYQTDAVKIDLAVPFHTPYRYLPLPAYTLGVVLNALSPQWAFRLWVAVIELTLLGCAYLSWRLGGGGHRGSVLAAMWLCFTPYYLEIYMGQFSLIQSALVLLMMVSAARPGAVLIGDLCRNRRRPQATSPRAKSPIGPLPRLRGWRFDLPWVASLLWKQTTGLFVPLLLRLRSQPSGLPEGWRSLGWAALAVLATSVPYFVLYPSALPAFLANFQSGPPTAQLGNLGVRQFLFSALSALVPSLSPAAQATLQRVWVGIVLGIGLWLTLEHPRPDAVLHLCLWATTYFMIYHHVWEHHYVMLLPVYVVLYHRSGSRAVLVLYALVAIWTPYILVDPWGMAARHAPMRWTPLQPPLLDVWYHASKAVPVLALWGHIVRSIWRRRLTKEAEGPCSPS